MTWTIPNILTSARIIAALCIALSFVFFDRPMADWVAFGIFLGAAVTDFLDGWLARRLGQSSELGRMLDPIADKVMVAVAMMCLLWQHAAAPLLAVPAVLIVVREVLVSGLREYLGSARLPVTLLSKWKTTVQMLAIGVLLAAPLALRIDMAAGDPISPNTFVFVGAVALLGILLLWIAALMTLVTGWDYFRRGLAYIREKEGGG